MFLGYKMSLLKWQEMAKSKSALGKKINFVHNAIIQKKLGDETRQIGFEKMFTPITTKLDDVVASNLRPILKPARRKKTKTAEIDYLPEVDPFEDMDVEGLFDEAVPPQPEKQIAPPTYEEIEQAAGDDPPEYEDESPDYTLAPEDETEAEETNDLLSGLSILSYVTVDAALGSSEMSATQKRNYLEKSIIPEANFRRNQLKGYKSSITKKFKKGEITEEIKNQRNAWIDKSAKILNEYIRHYKQKASQMTGSGLRRKKGGSIRFFSNPK